MLFNSFGFLFIYLPVVLAGYAWLGRYGPRAAMAWLTVASLAFYGYWDVRYLPLLLASIAGNFWLARRLGAAAGAARRRWLWAGLGANLLLLGYFKYMNFFVLAIGTLTGQHGQPWAIVLPIGISFFTFTQIAFLVDCYRGAASEPGIVQYGLFVSYFPHLIAGPVLHHREMMPQFADPAQGRLRAANVAVGLSIFVIGLAKKTLIADNLSDMVAPVYAAGAHPQLVEAWIATLAYTLQLYFDFSGYSDMAIGLSRLFGVKLPLNFNSPYKARDISDFWRCWHMTLSRFLRDYLYVPLGGNRLGPARRYANLMVTMLLGGLWHGAGWTFVLWGGLHGLYLVIQHAWRGWRGGAARWWHQPLTLMAVMLAWVTFRAPDLATAADVYRALAGGAGLSLPHGLAASGQLFASLGLHPGFDGVRWIDFGGLGPPTLAVAAVLALWAPNTQEIFFHYEPAIERIFHAPTWRWLDWHPSPAWGVAMLTLFLGCLLSMNKVSEFLYFQF
ncbi:MBOAT family O-acyltransferase [Rugamonas apoptosis]|uniref:Probable alginate O-acetylase AlgI n=1 Tax=Rugamonas apoptosis TaxID=2758570 RepID=A0A7W2F8U7_9BURK|nr:MBOAT family protein [Rugamonas apoptosis]MBA5687281.1 MBOAT family protein [Rugamonas apoptosis]